MDCSTINEKKYACSKRETEYLCLLSTVKLNGWVIAAEYKRASLGCCSKHKKGPHMSS